MFSCSFPWPLFLLNTKMLLSTWKMSSRLTESAEQTPSSSCRSQHSQCPKIHWVGSLHWQSWKKALAFFVSTRGKQHKITIFEHTEKILSACARKKWKKVRSDGIVSLSFALPAVSLLWRRQYPPENRFDSPFQPLVKKAKRVQLFESASWVLDGSLWWCFCVMESSCSVPLIQVTLRRALAVPLSHTGKSFVKPCNCFPMELFRMSIFSRLFKVQNSYDIFVYIFCCLAGKLLGY